MDVELHRADPKFRRRALPLFAGVAVLGAVSIWALYAWLDSASGLDTMVWVAAGLVGVLAAISFSLAVALWQEARLIRREDRFPATDMQTLRDVPVRHGAEARRIAGGMTIGAVFAALAGFGVLFWGWRLLGLVA